MTYDPQHHHRRSIRRPGWDYAQPAAYHVVLVTHKRRPLFGTVAGGAVQLSPAGEIVRAEWVASAARRAEIELDEFVIMPNHLHALVIVKGGGPEGQGEDNGHRSAAQGVDPGSLGALLAAFKAATTARIRAAGYMVEGEVWQRNYYDRIVRNERALNAMRRYIADNPANWGRDPHNASRD